MAMTHITPVRARVQWDRRTDRPASVNVGERRLTVTAVDSVRDEMSAYPRERGPRVTFLLETDGGQASLVFDARRRRWYLEALEAAA
jgi:hypothetical protein